MTASVPYVPARLDGRKYLVTGASSGLGKAIALTLASQGASLVLSGRDTTRLLETASELVDSSRHVVEAYDLNNHDGISDWVAELAKKYGKLNGIVCAAGTQITRPLRMIRQKDIDSQFSANLVSPMLLTKEFRRSHLINNESQSIVFITSVSAHTSQPANSVYCASKAGLTGYARSAAIELASDGLRVNCIAPGMVKTGMFAKNFLAKFTPDAVKDIEEKHPLGFGEPEDISNATLFLLSDMGKWITGTTLLVDGGYTAL